MRPTAILATTLLLACRTPDPAAETAHGYARDLTPLLLENGLIADQLLLLASAVHDEQAEPAEVRETWRRDLLPLAENLRDQAVLLQPPPPWNEAHRDLVEIWSMRADAWRDMLDAIDQGEADTWRRGRASTDQAKLREEAWFRDVNEQLSPYGIYLDQFP